MTRVMLVGLFAFFAVGQASASLQERNAGAAAGVTEPRGGNPWAASAAAVGTNGHLLAHENDRHRHDHHDGHHRHDGYHERYRIAERYHDHGRAHREAAIRRHRAMERRRAIERHREAHFREEAYHHHHDHHEVFEHAGR
ncbi:MULTISPECIES: hypothetical protein [Azotobacter]|nr:hypothetical protein [Azotobacter vinelandii]WKN22271.1 hypothetical protein AVAEIV_000231 [Azotobacter vinelandii]GLK58683.1 hypothetical protein GCM10017624_08400 [Azotobacter vinelandii]